jgi:cysteine-S-conjugate beta-lyase
MKYDFDRVIDRIGSDSAKWNVESMYGCSDVIPMWVADMDFPIAKPITEAIRKRTEHEIYGYSYTRFSLIEAVVSRMQKRYQWKIEPDWIVFTPGVVPALNVAIRAITHPGDEVIIQDPVYHPFWSAIEQSGCSIASNPLKLENGRYRFDIDDLAKKYADKQGGRRGPCRVKMMILCNPHNPIGRVWSREELIAAGNIVLGHDSIMVSDEIHCELLFKGQKHVPFASISKEFEQNSIVCQGDSKTFNLAGVPASTIIIPNVKLRKAFNNARAGILPQPDVFGLVALEAGYRDGDEWLTQVLDYLQGNLDFLMAFIKERIPEISVIKPEGTYLIWLDCRNLGMNNLTLSSFFKEKAKVGFDDGYIFGPAGDGFERMNIACPRVVLEEALIRIEKAVRNL